MNRSKYRSRERLALVCAAVPLLPTSVLESLLSVSDNNHSCLQGFPFKKQTIPAAWKRLGRLQQEDSADSPVLWLGGACCSVWPGLEHPLPNCAALVGPPRVRDTGTVTMQCHSRKSTSGLLLQGSR